MQFTTYSQAFTARTLVGTAHTCATADAASTVTLKGDKKIQWFACMLLARPTSLNQEEQQKRSPQAPAGWSPSCASGQRASLSSSALVPSCRSERALPSSAPRSTASISFLLCYFHQDRCMCMTLRVTEATYKGFCKTNTQALKPSSFH